MKGGILIIRTRVTPAIDMNRYQHTNTNAEWRPRYHHYLSNELTNKNDQFHGLQPHMPVLSIVFRHSDILIFFIKY